MPEDRLAVLVDERFDVAIRINPRKDSVLVGRCFARDRLVLAAAPSVQMPKGRGGEPFRVPAVVMPTYREGEVWSVRDCQLIIEPQPVLWLPSLLTVRDAAAARKLITATDAAEAIFAAPVTEKVGSVDWSKLDN